MTTINDDLKDREKRFGTGSVETEGVQGDAYADPNKMFPRKQYENQSSVNEAYRGGKQHNLSLGAGIQLSPIAATQYSKADIRETESGHVIEFNDTPAGERILFKHNSGAGIEIRPDGTVVVLAVENNVEVTHGDKKVVVEGDGTITYHGNLTLNVDGDFEVNCNNYKVNAKGDKTENIDGNSRTKIFGNAGVTTSGSYSQTVVGSTINTHLGNVTNAIKGEYKSAVEGNVIIASSGNLEMSAESKYVASSPDVNIAGTSLSLFGDTGTIGGENIIAYVKNIYGVSGDFSQRFKAPVFEGDLTGTANQAITSDVTNSQNYADPDPGGGTGSAQGYTVDTTAIDDTATAKPTADILDKYLNQSALGVKKPRIDIDNHLKNSLRVRKLTTQEVRSKLREQTNSDNAEFTASQVGQGKLNSEHANTTPPAGVGRTRKAGGICQRGSEPVGNATAERSAKTFRTNQQKKIFQIIPDNAAGAIKDAKQITSQTKLGRVPLARFIGAVDTGAFDSLSLVDKKKIARNYVGHIEMVKDVMGVNGNYKNHYLKVVEGYYAKELYGLGGPGGVEAETLTSGGLLDLRNKGRAVVYELVGPDGKIDPEGTFDLASDMAEIGMFDKLTLDYDNFNPDGSMNVQIIVEIPEIPESFKVTYKQEVETKFNNKLQASNSLVEIEPDPRNPNFA